MRYRVDGFGWSLSAVEAAQVALSLALAKHVPGWPGCTDEQMEAVAKAVVEALDERQETTKEVWLKRRPWPARFWNSFRQLRPIVGAWEALRGAWRIAR